MYESDTPKVKNIYFTALIVYSILSLCICVYQKIITVFIIIIYSTFIVTRTYQVIHLHFHFSELFIQTFY